MGISEAPQWLISAFVRSAEAVGATADKDIIKEHCLSLVERWSAPERIFHNLDHLINTLAALDEIISASHDPEMLRLAVWYHGAVFSTDTDSAYAGEAGEVMDPSADFARADLAEIGLEAEKIERIIHLILGLGRHSAEDSDIDAKVLIDAELSMLASSPQDYRKYRKAIAQEYSHIPHARFLAGRKMIITHLLKRRALFISPLGNQWEKPARENLEAELAKVNAQIEKLSPEEILQLEESPESLASSNTNNQNGEAEKLFREVEEAEAITGKIPVVEVAPLGISDPGEIVSDFEVDEPEIDADNTLETSDEDTEEAPSDTDETEETENSSETDTEAASKSEPKEVVYVEGIDSDDEDEEDVLPTISSTLEFADDCLDTAEMRAIKEAKRKGSIVPKMTNPDSE